MHLKAAAEVVGFTANLRVAAATYLVERNLIKVDEGTGVCTCSSLADLLKPVMFRPQDGCCTCHDHTLHGTCCHLLAAAELPAFAEKQVLTGMPVPEGEADQVGPQNSQ